MTGDLAIPELSSGLGGGAFMLHHRASTNTVQSYDGRETVPAAATEDDLRFVSNTVRTNLLPNLGSTFNSTKASGRAIGSHHFTRGFLLNHQLP